MFAAGGKWAVVGKSVRFDAAIQPPHDAEEKNSVKKEFILMITLELTDEDERAYVLSRVTKHDPKPNL